MPDVQRDFEDDLIDCRARERSLSRSGYLADLAQHDLDAHLGPGARPEVHAAFARLDELFASAPGADDGQDSTAIIRAMRDSR